jgi:hypothetical protein
MDCACVYSGDYDPPEFHLSITRIACKEHKCGECKGTIHAGEKYEVNVGKYDGRFDRHITCPDCVSVRDVFFCDGWVYGEVWERFSGYLDDAISGGYFSWSKLGEVNPTVRAEICEQIEEIWKEEEAEEVGR